jgi:eukaryotic-like serine/threonine-protein kinase
MAHQDDSTGALSRTRRPERIVRFGPYEFRPATQDLRKNGARLKVQAKPLQILSALVDRPGEVLTREELCRELWSEGTFVDFESGLNTATNRLRAALNDSAEQPRYIETLPRLGYRFICPVVENGLQISASNLGEAEAAPSAPSPMPVTPQPLSRFGWLKSKYAVPVVLAFHVVIGAGVYWIIRTEAASAQPVFHPVTYRPEAISSARFLPGANTAIFTVSSSHDGDRTLRTGVDGGNFEPDTVAPGALMSVSRTGHVAVLDWRSNEKATKVTEFWPEGRKSELNVQNISGMDWLPSGKNIALIRRVTAETTIEFPAGRVIYRTVGRVTNLRVSPAGDRLAFLEHPDRDDNRGHVTVLEQNGSARRLTADWSSADGLAWSPSGREIWFTASKVTTARTLYAVSLTGKLRKISTAPASLRVFDIAPNGRVLVSVDEMRNAMFARFPGASQETDVTHFDQSTVQDMSRDGQSLLFTESGDAGGQHYTALLYDYPTRRSRVIGSGRAMALSPDKQMALTLDLEDDSALNLVDLRSGNSRRLSGGGVHYQWARFLSNSVILVGAAPSGTQVMLYRQLLDGSPPRPLAGLPYLDYPVVSSDGGKVVGLSGKDLVIVHICDKSVQTVPLDRVSVPVAWSADQRSLYILPLTSSPLAIMKLDTGSGSLLPWKAIQTSHSPSFGRLCGVAAAPDAGAYAYSFYQNLSRLYVVDGWSSTS